MNSNLEREVEQRTEEMERKNIELKMVLANMQQGVFMIMPPCHIHPEYSAYMEIIFETKNFEYMDLIDLFENADIDRDSLVMMRSAIIASFEKEDIYFELNESSLPRSIVLKGKEKNRHLELTWTPILEDGLIEKILVTVYDKTEILALKRDTD